jgi:hypothetical protein
MQHVYTFFPPRRLRANAPQLIIVQVPWFSLPARVHVLVLYLTPRLLCNQVNKLTLIHIITQLCN